MMIGSVPSILWLIGEDGIVVAVLGLFAALAGFFWYRRRRATWHPRIETVSGESTPLSSKNKAWSDGIARAINEAIIQQA